MVVGVGCGTSSPKANKLVASSENVVASVEQRAKSIEQKHNKSEINNLIFQLGAEDWETREKAQKGLTKIGEGLIEQYRKAKLTAKAQSKEKIKNFADALRKECKSKDPEIKKRASEIRHYFCWRIPPRIAFISGANICVVDVVSKEQKQLTNNLNIAPGFPIWSPDGTKIAFTWSSQIFVMDADGNNKKKLAEKVSNSFVWSPDGSKIVFESWGGLVIMDADGRNRKKLPETEGYSPSFNPNGDKITFIMPKGLSCEECGSDNTDIYMIDANGKNKKRLTNTKGKVKGFEWSPNGSKIVFTLSEWDRCSGGCHEKDGNADIYIIDADGRNQEQLTKTPIRDLDASWSPDGDKIIFVSGNNLANINYKIYIMDTDGKNQKKLSTNKEDNFMPVWSPDGKRIVFVSFHDKNKNTDIYIMDTDGKNQIRLTKNKEDDFAPTWSPIYLPEISVLFKE